MDIIQMTLNEQIIIQYNQEIITPTVEENRGFSGLAITIKAPKTLSVDREEVAILKKRKPKDKLAVLKSDDELQFASPQSSL